ncbi:MAG: phage coat protein [Rickettsiales bacterium]|nr:MAG: phage coat protein [Rickettsiales bacterium]
MNSVKEKMLNKYNQAGIVAGSLILANSAHATETSNVEQLFNSVDMGGVATAVVTIGGTVLGIFLAYKGITLVKRAISKA